MRAAIAAAIAASFLLSAGCNNAKSPEAVAKDVAQAEQNGAAEVAKSQDMAAKDLDKSAAKVDDRLSEFNNTAAKDAYNVALAQADADRKVALAQCDASSGDVQKNCKDQAEANYSAAKADARATALSAKQ